MPCNKIGSILSSAIVTMGFYVERYSNDGAPLRVSIAIIQPHSSLSHFPTHTPSNMYCIHSALLYHSTESPYDPLCDGIVEIDVATYQSQ